LFDFDFSEEHFPTSSETRDAEKHANQLGKAEKRAMAFPFDLYVAGRPAA
jgi:hypothetical protein